MAPRSRSCQSSRVNTPVDPTGELNKLAGAQAPARRSNAGSNKASTKAPIPPKAPTSPLVPSPTENLFIRFMKVFMETFQAQALTKPRERLLKVRTPETYSGKSYLDFYYFCQQCEDYFKTSGVTGMNCTPFVATFLHSTVSVRWAQHKRRHKSATLITWPEFKNFLWKNLGDSQVFIDSIWSKFRKDS